MTKEEYMRRKKIEQRKQRRRRRRIKKMIRLGVLAGMLLIFILLIVGAVSPFLSRGHKRKSGEPACRIRRGHSKRVFHDSDGG